LPFLAFTQSHFKCRTPLTRRLVRPLSGSWTLNV